jgi:hypothetical protein
MSGGFEGRGRGVDAMRFKNLEDANFQPYGYSQSESKPRSMFDFRFEVSAILL